MERPDPPVALERVTGIEPAWPAWKAGALPLSYTREASEDSSGAPNAGIAFGAMQFTQDSHAAVASGAITVTFRFWKRPHAKVGGRYTVGPVVIEVDAIEMMPFAAISRADVRLAGAPDREALRARAAHAGPIADDTLLYRIEFHVVGAREARVDAPATDEQVALVTKKLDAMDTRSKTGPWTRAVLELIGEHEGVVSTELAAIVQRPRLDFKADVRKLKALGLTESLEVGYRLTPLGQRIVGP